MGVGLEGQREEQRTGRAWTGRDMALEEASNLSLHGISITLTIY
jgi:hypothetical protein